MEEINVIGQVRNHSSRNGAAVRLFCMHTQEGNGRETVYDLLNWLKRADNASYHYAGRGGIVLDLVDTDRASWSCLDANRYTINWCFAGSKASQSRQTWLDGWGQDIDNAARIFVQDAKKYDPLSPDVLAQDYKAIAAGRTGAMDHSGVTYGLRIGNHTDVGPNFPWDVFAAAVEKYSTSYVPPVVVPNAIDELRRAPESEWLGNKLSETEQSCPDGRGRWVKYEHGYVYWTAETGARAIPNALFETYAALGFEAGDLGYPVAHRTILPGGLVQAFERGVLYRETGAPEGYFVHGVIGNRWARDGYENGPLGYPRSNEYPHDVDGRQQKFANGVATWDPSGAVVSIVN